MSWPDHGVPDDCSDFLSFVNDVRQYRCGVVESTIVHCRCVTSLFETLLPVCSCYFILHFMMLTFQPVSAVNVACATSFVKWFCNLFAAVVVPA